MIVLLDTISMPTSLLTAFVWLLMARTIKSTPRDVELIVRKTRHQADEMHGNWRYTMRSSSNTISGRRFGWLRGVGLGAAAALAVMTLGGCYGSYSYSSYHYDPPCAPAVVVRETFCAPVYCAPRPVIVVDHYHGHYGHSHGGHGGGHRSYRRW